VVVTGVVVAGVVVAGVVVAGEWQALENIRRWRMAVAGEWQALEKSKAGNVGGFAATKIAVSLWA
jgi:hypothetical protein